MNYDLSRFKYKLSTNLKRMTFILGSRCSDGVVLIADKKITFTDYSDFDYREKLFGDISNVIFGSSGSTDTFELFRGYVMEHIRTHPGDIIYDNAITKLSEITRAVNARFDFRSTFLFDVLVAIKYPGQSEKKSSLTYITGYGSPCTLEKYEVLGMGRNYASIILRNAWDKKMPMKQVAELGYLCIKCIEDFRLNLTVGVGENYPTIWYIPDNPSGRDHRLEDGEIKELKTNTEKRVRKIEKQIANLFV